MRSLHTNKAVATYMQCRTEECYQLLAVVYFEVAQDTSIFVRTYSLVPRLSEDVGAEKRAWYTALLMRKNYQNGSHSFHSIRSTEVT